MRWQRAQHRFYDFWVGCLMFGLILSLGVDLAVGAKTHYEILSWWLASTLALAIAFDLWEFGKGTFVHAEREEAES